MNIQEKRKLEELIRSQISKAKSAYKSRRDVEKHAIVEKLRANPPKEIAGLVADCKKENERHEKAIEALKGKAQKCNYELVDNYRGVHLDYATGHPSIKAHDDDTQSNLVAIEGLTDDFVLDVWSENGEMQTIATSLTVELERLTGSV